MTQTPEELAKCDPRVRRLAAIVAGAVRVEPALMRAARVKFFPDGDPGLEADVWFSEFVEHRGPSGIVFDAAAASQLRAELARDDPALYEAARALVVEMHAHLPRELRLEEEVAYLEHCALPDRRELIDALLKRAIAALLDPAREGLARWAARALPRFSSEILARHDACLLADGSRARLRGSLTGDSDREGELSPWIAHVVPSDLPKVPVVARLFPGMLELVVGESREGGMTLDVPATDPIVLELRSFPLQGAAKTALPSERLDETYWENVAERWRAKKGGVARGAPKPRRIQLPLRGSRVLSVERGRVELRTLFGERHVLRPEPIAFVAYAYTEPDLTWGRRLARALSDAGVGIENSKPLIEFSQGTTTIASHEGIARAGAFIVVRSHAPHRDTSIERLEWPAIAEQCKRDGTPVFVVDVDKPTESELTGSHPFPPECVSFSLERSLVELDASQVNAWLPTFASRVSHLLLGIDEVARSDVRRVVDVSHLQAGGGPFIGRTAELAQLDRSWNDGDRIVALLGPPGSGKTALVREWLTRLEEVGWSGAEHIFAWSFESDPSLSGFLTGLAESFDPGALLDLEQTLALLAQRRWLLIIEAPRERGSAERAQLLSVVERLAGHRSGMLILVARDSDPVPLVVTRIVENIASRKITLGPLHESEVLTLIRARAPDFPEDAAREVLDAVGSDNALLTAIAPALQGVRPWNLATRLEEQLGVRWPDTAVRIGAPMEVESDDAGVMRLQMLLALFRRPLMRSEISELDESGILGSRHHVLSGSGPYARTIERGLQRGWLSSNSARSLSLHPALHAAVRISRRSTDEWRRANERLLERGISRAARAAHDDAGLIDLLDDLVRARDAGDLRGGRESYLEHVALQPAHRATMARLRALFELESLATVNLAVSDVEGAEVFCLEAARLFEALGQWPEAIGAWREAIAARQERTRTLLVGGEGTALVVALLSAGRVEQAVTDARGFLETAQGARGSEQHEGLLGQSAGLLHWSWFYGYVTCVLHGDTTGRRSLAEATEQLALGETPTSNSLVAHTDSRPTLAFIEHLLTEGRLDEAERFIESRRSALERLQNETAVGRSEEFLA